MLLKYLKEYTIMTLGLAVFVCGWVAFLNPHEITGGGIAGLASVIHYGINSIPVSYAKFAIDILLLVAGFIILGKGFGIKTIYCVAMSFVFFQFMPMIPGLTSISAGITDNLINALIGGAMSGIGIAIIITQGGSTGGTDIIALSINKYKNISPGRIYLVCDSLIVMSILLVNDKTLAYSISKGSTGIQSPAAGNSYIYPNPTRDLIHVHLASDEGGIEIFSISGQCMLQQKLTGKESTLDIAQLAKGTYLVRLSEQGQTTVCKLLKD